MKMELIGHENEKLYLISRLVSEYRPRRQIAACLNANGSLKLTQGNGCTVCYHAIFAVKTACLLAAIAIIFVPGCSRRPTKWDPNNLDDKYPFISSISEAKKRETFEFEVEIIPNVWKFAGKEITFESAWLERLPEGYFEGRYALCFRIDQGKQGLRITACLNSRQRAGFL